VVDTSIWVKALVPTEPQHRQAQSFVQDVIRGRHDILLPYPVLTETVCALSRVIRNLKTQPPLDLPEEWAQQMLRLPNVAWLVADRQFASIAAVLGMFYGLRGMDVLVACAAFQGDCGLLSADTAHLAMRSRLPNPLQLADAVSRLMARDAGREAPAEDRGSREQLAIPLPLPNNFVVCDLADLAKG
jgi:predicted nucleic acid-binding protein